jgi:hypothetical protein
MEKTLWLNCLDNASDNGWTKKKYLLRAAEQMGIEYVRDIKSRTIEDVEYVLNIEPYDEIIKGSKWTGAWQIDLLINLPRFTKDWHQLDTIFCAISRSEVEIRGNKVLLFQAFDPEFHKKTPGIEQHDFVLVGSTENPIYEKRIQAISVLSHKFNFNFLGKGYSPEKFSELMSKARVQFICSAHNEKGEGELAQRFFESLAIGPVLTNNVPDLQYTSLVEGVDYLSYKNEEEMIKKMEFLLKNKEYADKIAFNGRMKGLNFHTFYHRLLTILGYAFYERA